MKCEKWSVLGETRVGFFALRDIPKGTELTIDYQFSTIAGTGLVTGMQKCACDSLRCRGFLGAKVGGAKRRIRPEWCEELQVGMLCDVLAGDKTWRPGKVCEMGDRGGVTHLRIQYLPDNATSNIPAVRVKHADNAIDSTKSSTIVGNSCEWIPITSMIERIAPARAFTSPEAVQRRKTEESIRQREAAAANAQKQAEAATKAEAKRRRQILAQKRAQAKIARQLAEESAARAALEKRKTALRHWGTKKLSEIQKACCQYILGEQVTRSQNY